MEILRKFVFYTLAVLVPIELVCAILCMFSGKKTEELLRLVRVIVTV